MCKVNIIDLCCLSELLIPGPVRHIEWVSPPFYNKLTKAQVQYLLICGGGT